MGTGALNYPACGAGCTFCYALNGLESFKSIFMQFREGTFSPNFVFFVEQTLKFLEQVNESLHIERASSHLKCILCLSRK